MPGLGDADKFAVVLPGDIRVIGGLGALSDGRAGAEAGTGSRAVPYAAERRWSISEFEPTSDT